MRMVIRAALAACSCLVASLAPAQTATAPPATTVQVNRASRDTWTPVMDILKTQRTPVTDAQMARLRELPIEAIWGALQGRQYQLCFVTGFEGTQPGAKLVGRALTMRYMPVRPDLMDGIKTLAKEGDWDFQYNVRAGEDAKPGDVIVVELGGMVDKATFMGDVTGLGIQSAGVTGVVIDGGLRDLSEFVPMRDFPVYYKGAHASAMADQVGVEWNAPVRIGTMTVLPGDVVIADVSGVLAFPPQLTGDLIKDAESTVHVENFKREMMRSRKYRARDIYPKLSPELEKAFDEWQRTHPKEGVVPR
jgi:4-hydroxy-4-methyl-2-oxoglutarate aldolase